MRLYFTYLIYEQQDILLSVCFLCNVCWMLLQMAKKAMNKHNCVDNISSDIYGPISMSQNNKNITSWCSKQIKLEVLSHIIGSHSPSWLVLGDQWIMNSKYCFNIQYYIDCSMKKNSTLISHELSTGYKKIPNIDTIKSRDLSHYMSQRCPKSMS